jgi:hypothetical protein
MESAVIEREPSSGDQYSAPAGRVRPAKAGIPDLDPAKPMSPRKRKAIEKATDKVLYAVNDLRWEIGPKRTAAALMALAANIATFG